MSLWQALVLGVVQGATEFLPISSSGHLVLVPWLLGWHVEPGAAFVFDVLVQWGTLLAVIGYFRHELLELISAAIRGLLRGRPLSTPAARLAWLLVLASVPAAALGVSLRQPVEAAFDNPRAVSLFLLATAAILALSERLGGRHRQIETLRPSDVLLIGVAQSLALFPGISRSGSTIGGGLLRDLERPEAARFSFLMSVPIMIGAGLVTLMELATSPAALEQVPPLLVGFAAAAVVGYLSIRWLLRYLAQRPLTIFIAYCSLTGALSLMVSFFHG